MQGKDVRSGDTIQPNGSMSRLAPDTTQHCLNCQGRDRGRNRAKVGLGKVEDVDSLRRRNIST